MLFQVIRCPRIYIAESRIQMPQHHVVGKSSATESRTERWQKVALFDEFAVLFVFDHQAKEQAPVMGLATKDSIDGHMPQRFHGRFLKVANQQILHQCNVVGFVGSASVSDRSTEIVEGDFLSVERDRRFLW